MEFLKTVWKNKKIIGQLGRNDFRNRFANTSLGSIWGFLQPFIFMATYAIVFQFILKTGSAGNDPYVVWFMPGMAMWQTIMDTTMSASTSIMNYSYLVKKVVFPLDIIPMISIVSSGFVGIFLFTIAIIIGCIFKYIPNFLQIIYIIIAAYVFLISFTRFTSAVTTLVPDFGNLLTIAMQLFFWFTPVVWNMSMIQNHALILKVMKCMPFNYLVTGFRDSFIEGNIITESNYIYTIAFWIITLMLFVWGNHVFNKNKKDFADVL